MAVLSFGVNGPTMNFTVDMEIKDSDAPRILSYLSSTHYGKISDTITDDEGNTQNIIRDATLEETAKAFASGILRGLLDQTVRYEKDKAAQEAAEKIENIDPIQ